METTDSRKTDNTITVQSDHATAKPNNTKTVPTSKPEIDVFESASELLLVADMPGISKSEIQLKVDNEQLTLEGRWSGETTKDTLFSEFEPVNYRRVLRLPDGLDLDKVTAKMTDGVLKVHLPFADAYQPRQIEVEGVN